MVIKIVYIHFSCKLGDFDLIIDVSLISTKKYNLPDQKMFNQKRIILEN